MSKRSAAGPGQQGRGRALRFDGLCLGAVAFDPLGEFLHVGLQEFANILVRDSVGIVDESLLENDVAFRLQSCFSNLKNHGVGRGSKLSGGRALGQPEWCCAFA